MYKILHIPTTRFLRFDGSTNQLLHPLNKIYEDQQLLVYYNCVEAKSVSIGYLNSLIEDLVRRSDPWKTFKLIKEEFEIIEINDKGSSIC